MASTKQSPAVEELLAHAGWMRSLARGLVGDPESPVAADATFRLTGLPSVEAEIVLLQGDLELCRVPIGSRGARDVVLRPER